MPLEDHEFASELISLFIRILVAELGLKLKSLRSTTLGRSELNRAVEPDNAFYISNYAKVAGKTIDLTSDPHHSGNYIFIKNFGSKTKPRPLRRLYFMSTMLT